jgi:regulator of replication initiation timing
MKLKKGYIISSIIVLVLISMIVQKNTAMSLLIKENEQLKLERFELNDSIQNRDDVIAESNQKNIILELDKVRQKDQIFDQYRLKALERLGYPSVDEIRDSLYEQPELIGESAILGGTMGFSNIFLLDEQYAYAKFEDGHIDGGGLYSYVYEDSVIIWTRLDDHLFE